MIEFKRQKRYWCRGCSGGVFEEISSEDDDLVEFWYPLKKEMVNCPRCSKFMRQEEIAVGVIEIYK